MTTRESEALVSILPTRAVTTCKWHSTITIQAPVPEGKNVPVAVSDN